MDASTALRFHFGELIISVPWRAGQILLIGVSPLSLVVWQSILFVMILFHHSNVRLPIGVERRLNLLIVTPRMPSPYYDLLGEQRTRSFFPNRIPTPVTENRSGLAGLWNKTAHDLILNS